MTVPANQNAIITDIKSYCEAVKSGRRNSKKDADAIREAISLLQGVLEESGAEDGEEGKSKSNGAPEETKTNANSTKAADILEKINSMKENKS